jgi:hypothetical protein
VKNRFQSLPFKRNLQRYTAVFIPTPAKGATQADCMYLGAKDLTVGLCALESN